MRFVPGSGVLVTPRTFSRFHYQGKTNGVNPTGPTMVCVSRSGPIPAHWLAYLPCPAGDGVGASNFEISPDRAGFLLHLEKYPMCHVAVYKYIRVPMVSAMVAPVRD